MQTQKQIYSPTSAISHASLAAPRRPWPISRMRSNWRVMSEMFTFKHTYLEALETRNGYLETEKLRSLISNKPFRSHVS